MRSGPVRIHGARRGGGAAAGIVLVLLATGCLWQEQRLARADVVGTWTGGSAGTLHLRDDGTAVATRLAEYDADGDKVSECDGTGTWSLYPGDEAAELVTVTVCEGNPWNFGGSEEEPEMRRSVGDPEYGNFQTLSRER
ncbi:hypothetical protein [Streptomyces sp. NPDC056600]|uniref:hypothetical protein n=1 Tax=Streptomyces sp. NPDC056600 TaxID=3345874 RepID=UPI00368AF3BE